MKSYVGGTAFLNLLNSAQQFSTADCYTITLNNGSIYRWTSMDVDVVYNGYVYSSNCPILTRGKTKVAGKLEVAELDLTIAPRTSDTLNGIPWITAIVRGALDGAWVQLDRAFFSGPQNGNAVGGVNLFYGMVGDIQIQRTAAKLKIMAPTYIFNIQMPRNLYQANCLHVLYDSGCKLLQANFQTGPHTVLAGATDGVIPASVTGSIAQTEGIFNLGSVQFITGALAGVQATVKTYAPGSLSNYTFTLVEPQMSAPAAGDTFYAYPGCDKTQATCSGALFNNLTNFRGFPYVPAPETVL